jgi:hypothetical protein
VAIGSRLPRSSSSAAALASASSASLPSGALYGVVTKGPIAPVCSAGQQCNAPVRVTLVFSRAGKDVAQTKSSVGGRYRITVPYGYYSVRTLERIGIDHNIRPRKLHIRANKIDRLDFSIDTGIR